MPAVLGTLLTVVLVVCGAMLLTGRGRAGEGSAGAEAAAPEVTASAALDGAGCTAVRRAEPAFPEVLCRGLAAVGGRAATGGGAATGRLAYGGTPSG